MGTIDRHSAQHYSWGIGCDGWHLVRTKDHSIIEERMPPGTSEVRHYHQKAAQFFYVLKGALFIDIDGRGFSLSPGQGVEVDPGQIHQVDNRGAVDAEFLVFSSPPSHGDRIEV